jgi:hypothetical protein
MICSYIANHVIKEKIERYNNEAMIVGVRIKKTKKILQTLCP